MSSRPARRLSALGGALLIGTLGLGMTSVHAAPEPPESPAAPAPVEASAAERISVIVLLKDQPTALSLEAEKGRLQEQQRLSDDWADRFGLELDRQFGYLVNGFSATIPADRLHALALEPEVASVRRERVYERTEHTARELHGVPAAFNEHGLDGTGMVISVVDSGIDPAHPAMRLDDCSAAAIQEINTSAAEAGFTCKVPNGYNYADENFIIKDATTDAHGQHVAGIAAANGSEGDVPGDVTATGTIDGGAPNAQILAMKVFSNSGGGAADSDIVAAIEDSVKLEADVINMSLGAPNGQKNASDAAGIAIDAARDAGVLTVIAAGNDGQNFSPTGENGDVFGLHDDGTVGAPGTQGSALTVASVDNAVLTQKVAFVGDSAEGIGYSVATGDPADGQDHEIVDLGLATADEVAGQELDGAWALIERGDITFTEKYENAITAGAGGVVVFNNAPGTFGMAGVETFTIPGITVSQEDGLAIRAAIEAGGTTIRVTEDVAVSPSPSALTPSSFTSWGSTPSLDFEPEIAGIGGNVYSTYNDGTYGLNSGTSMASPNVAGLSALVMQHLDQIAPELSGTERVDMATVLLMNTAMIPMDDAGVPYSPRQIGAGLGQVDKAVSSKVIATVDGRGAAALREIGTSASFTVNLRNFGGTDASFTVPGGQQVLAESNGAGYETEMRVSGGTLSADRAEVSVPAGGTAAVTFTLSPESGADGFVGGWATLQSGTDGQPTLTVPYLGFAGDWNAEDIVHPAGQELIADSGVRTELVTSWAGMTLPLDNEIAEFWLSPNGDGDMDVIAPNLVIQRNASDLRYEILDASGEPIKVVGEEQGVYRPLLSQYTAAADPRQLQWTGANFDGITWDAQVADFATLPDGRYSYRVSARLSADQEWQTTDLPFGIDATAPEIEFGAYEAGVLTFTVVEDGSGILQPPAVTAADGTEIPVVEGSDGTYTVEVDPAEVAFLTVSVLDAGFNLGVGTKVFGDSPLVVANAEQLATSVIGPNSQVVSDGALLLSGYVSSDIAAVRAGGQEVDSPNGRFLVPVALVEGEQEILVEALDAEGAVIEAQTLTVTYDSEAPRLTLTEPADGEPVTPAQDGSVTITGTVTDTREGAALTVTAGDQTAEAAEDGSFSITVAPAADAAAVTLVASDGVNRASTAVPIAGREAAPAWALPEITNADCILDQGACFVPGDTPDANEDGSVFTLRGTYPAGGTITLYPGLRASEDGTYPDRTPIEVAIAENGEFAVDLPVQTGENHVRMMITDAEGAVRYDRGVRIFFDVTAPTLEVEEPTLIGGTLYTAQEQVTLAGTAADDGWGYRFALNDSVVLERFDLASPGEQSNSRDFSTEITVADGDTLLVEFSDSNGNVLLGLVPVVLDQAAPEVNFEELTDGEVLTEDREITVAAEDDHLATMTVGLDGEAISSQATDLSVQEHAFEAVLVDLRDLQTMSTGAMADAAQTRLETVVDTEDLEPGEHTLTVVSTDLAGNRTVESRVFTIDSRLEIEGPEAVELEVHRELLGDQDALAELVLADFQALLDGDAEAAEDAGATLALAPNQVLVEGESTVTVIATDAEGRTAEREVAVTLALKQVTLTDGDVTATSTFRSDDALTVKIEEEGAARVLTLANREGFAALDAVITVPGVEGSRVVRVLPDGREITVTATWADGVLTFEGPSKGTYRIVPPSAPEQPGDAPGGGKPGGTPGGGKPGDTPGGGKPGGTPGGGKPGDTPGGGKPGDTPGGGKPGDTPGGGKPGDAPGRGGDARPTGPLSRTGVEAWGMAAAALTLLGSGALMVGLRRR
ncbi:S8 family serine peptidase [Brachybacterium epidermidis]|uniref:S8 family serine peptidase n=1 Tax=Brachybacterium epidermidis TaxID=2781983 RepID=UPI00398F4893